MSPLKSIRKHCLFCMNGSSQFVKECPAPSCPLYELRLGKSVKGVRPLKQIRSMCRECVETANDIAECDGEFLTGDTCPIHAYRFGKKPKK
jgi:hypothetical protein